MRETDSRTVVCDNCGKTTPATQQDTAPDYGWSINTNALGYYGGFDDNLDASRESEVLICHDCVVSLIESFPAFAKNIERGGHPAVGWSSSSGPCTDVKPCCKYCWGWERYINEDGKAVYVQYLANDAGEWEFDTIHIQ